jgi:tellurium resistance protein TerD
MSDVINLKKGERIDLAKVAPNTTRFAFALGWKPQQFDGKDFDLDASAFLTKDGVCSGVADMVGYMTPGFVTQEAIDAGLIKDPGYRGIKDYLGFATHTGDDKTGGKPGDDETIIFDTKKVDTNKYNDIQFNCTIYEAKERNQTFGQVDDAFIRVYDADTQKEVCRFDLTEDYSLHTAVVVGKLYHKDTWKFQAVGGGYINGLSGLCAGVGLSAVNG